MTKEKLDLLFIDPSVNYNIDKEKVLARRIEEGVPNQENPHLGIAYLLAVAKQNGIRAKFVDMAVESVSLEDLLQYINENRPRLIGFTAYTIQIKAAGFIAKEIKKHFSDALICCGGSHAIAAPRETIKEFDAFDFVVCGEGEIVLTEVFKHLRSGRPLLDIKGVITRERDKFYPNPVSKLDDLLFPAWEEFDLTKYLGTYHHRTKLELPMTTSRGCPSSCVFCCRSFGRKRRHRSIPSVIKEIERNINDFGCEAIIFNDETFIANVKWSEELFNTMISRGLNEKIRWACETRIDNCSPELFHLMRKAGCIHIFFGFESADDKILKNANKGFNVSQIRKAVRWAKEAGFICAGSFILGLPGETEETVDKTIKLAKELGIYSTTFPIAVPFPGTAIREMALKHEYGLRLLSNNWDDYGKQYPGVMESEVLNIDRLRQLQKKAYEYNPKKKLPV